MAFGFPLEQPRRLCELHLKCLFFPFFASTPPAHTTTRVNHAGVRKVTCWYHVALAAPEAPKLI